MHITSVGFENFRNYHTLELPLGNGINVFYGDNAQGKTNFIEGVYLTAMGKSFKYGPEKNMILFQKPRALAQTEFYTENMLQTNSVSLYQEKPKILKADGVIVKKRVEMMGRLHVILFTPQELNIIREGPHFRRRFLDLCGGQLRHKYLYAISNYNRCLEQKNKLLKTVGNNTSLLSTIEVWNQKMADFGSIVLWYRLSLIQRMKRMIQPIYQEITDHRETLSFTYLRTVPCKEEMEIKEIKEVFQKELSKNSRKELEAGNCLVGPHRDDLLFYINGKSVKPFASQGQQRSIVLALKMVQTELYYEETGEYPILLLDDIASELDSRRREFLFHKIREKQVILTCTDAEGMEFLGDTAYFQVESGQVTRTK